MRERCAREQVAMPHTQPYRMIESGQFPKPPRVETRIGRSKFQDIGA